MSKYSKRKYISMHTLYIECIRHLEFDVLPITQYLYDNIIATCVYQKKEATYSLNEV